MTKTNIPAWDLKYYRRLHISVQHSLGKTPIAYENFAKRLRNGMTLHDAVFMERNEWKVPNPPTLEVQQRRLQKLKDENIPLVTFKDFPKARKKNRRNMKPHKKTLREKFISLFK